MISRFVTFTGIIFLTTASLCCTPDRQSSPYTPQSALRVGVYDAAVLQTAFAGAAGGYPPYPRFPWGYGGDAAYRVATVQEFANWQRRAVAAAQAIIKEKLKTALPAVADEAKVEFIVDTYSRIPPTAETVDVTDLLLKHLGFPEGAREGLSRPEWWPG